MAELTRQKEVVLAATGTTSGKFDGVPPVVCASTVDYSTGAQKRELLDAALAYAARGWAVFPIVAGGKQPATPHGFKDATTDAAQIKRWWAANPRYNIGIAAGLSGLAVIDLDVKHGHDGIAEYERLGWGYDGALVSVTPSNGMHVIYTAPPAGIPSTAGALAAGIDTRGNGGYIVAPPSVLTGDESGNYAQIGEWDAVTPAVIPAGLLARLRPQKVAAVATSSAAQSAAGANGRLAALERHVAQTAVGARNRALIWAACVAGGMVQSGAITRGEAEAALTRAAEANGWAAEEGGAAVARVIAAGLQHGDANPNWRGGAVVVAQPVVTTTTTETAAAAAVEDVWDGDALLQATFPPVAWVVDGLLPPGLCALGGRPKVGKSWLALQLAVAVASGGRFLGRQLAAGRVVYLALEDTPDTLQERLRALTRALPAGGATFALRWADFVTGDGVDRLWDAAQGARLVVVDTLKKASLGVAHKDEEKIAPMLARLHQMAGALGCAVMLIDHHKKPGLGGEDAVDDLLGATAKAGIMDTIWGMYRDKERAEDGPRSARLDVIGRRGADTQVALTWDAALSCWQYAGTAEEVARRKHSEAVLAAIAETGGTFSELVKVVRIDKGNLSRELRKLEEQGLILKTTGGCYLINHKRE